MLFHFDRRKKSEKEKKPPRFLVLRRKWLTLGAAVLAAAAVENPTFRRICSSRSVTIGQRTMENHNRLLRQVEGCVGLKTGYTRAAGRTLVSCAERDGCRLVAVTLQDGNDWADHAALYDYGFRLTAPRRGVQTALLRLREPLTAACAALHS